MDTDPPSTALLLEAERDEAGASQQLTQVAAGVQPTAKTADPRAKTGDDYEEVHTYIHTHIHTLHTYIQVHTYIHAYIPWHTYCFR